MGKGNGNGNGSLSLSNSEDDPEFAANDDNVVEYDEFELNDIESLESMYDALMDAQESDMPLEIVTDITAQMVQCYLESLRRLAQFGDKVNIFELAKQFDIDIREAILDEWSVKDDDKPKE